MSDITSDVWEDAVSDAVSDTSLDTTTDIESEAESEGISEAESDAESDAGSVGIPDFIPYSLDMFPALPTANQIRAPRASVMFGDREPTRVGFEENFSYGTNEKIKAQDEHLFVSSVSFTGNNAPTWNDALTRVSPLLACNEEYRRFDQAPGNVKAWDYPPVPGEWADNAAIYSTPLRGSEAPSRPSWSTEESGSSSRMSRKDKKNFKYQRRFSPFPFLPKELRDEIWLATEEPRILSARIWETTELRREAQARINICITGGHARHQPGNIRNRDFRDIQLYGICPESRELAIREYGRPSNDAIPFRPKVDELWLDVDFKRKLVDRIWSANGDNDCYRGDGYTYRPRDVPNCELCAANMDVINDVKNTVIFSSDEPIPQPKPYLREGRKPYQDQDTLLHPVYRPASKAMLDRFRDVTLNFRNHNFFQLHDRPGDHAQFKRMYDALGRALPKAFPRLETLTIRVDPMRELQTLSRPRHCPETQHLYDLHRVLLLDGLTAAAKHDAECRKENCRCQLLPFARMKRLVVRVNTHNQFNVPFAARRHFREWFSIRATGMNAVACPKGVAPLTNNGELREVSSRDRFRRDKHDDPRGLLSKYGGYRHLIQFLNRPELAGPCPFGPFLDDDEWPSLP